MRRNVLFTIGLVLTGIALLASCEPIGMDRSVRISARSTGFSGTKAVYSGDVDDQSGIERINWEENDRLRVYSPQLTTRPLSPGVDPDDLDHFSDYIVTGVQTEGSSSKATVQNANGNGLYWPDDFTGTADFYAIYPATACRGDFWVFPLTIQSSQTLSWNSAGTVGQTAEPLYLLARTTGVSNSSTVNLDFVPVFTAFEIHLKCDEGVEEKSLTSVSLSNASTGDAGVMAGTCLFNMKTEALSFENPSSSVSVDLTGKTISQTKEVVFTLLAMPQDLTNLKLTVTYSNGGTPVSRTLALNYSDDTPVTFNAGKKYVLRGIALQDGWTFSVDLGLNVMEWTVGGNTTIDYSETVTSTPFVFESTQYANVAVDIDEIFWDITFDTTNPNSALYITFNISAPVGATWSVQKEDPSGYFTLAAMKDGAVHSPMGTVGEDGGLITLRICPNFANIPAERPSAYSMVLHTFVEVGDKAYNIDSETQSFDVYHNLAEFIIPANQ